MAKFHKKISFQSAEGCGRKQWLKIWPNTIFSRNFDLKSRFSRKVVKLSAFFIGFLDSQGSKTYPKKGFRLFPKTLFFSKFWRWWDFSTEPHPIYDSKIVSFRLSQTFVSQWTARAHTLIGFRFSPHNFQISYILLNLSFYKLQSS